MIDFENVSVSFGSRKVLNDINFSLNKSENLVILGENGVGKSTLAKSLTGLLRPEGKINLFDEDISKIENKKRALLINYIPAKLESFDGTVTLEEYLLLGRYPYKKRFEEYSEDEINRADELLTQFGLIEHKNNSIELLSSGQKQMAMIAQAVMQNSRITIFDEPVSNLDPLNVKKTFDIIKNSDLFRTKIVITHDMNFAYNLGYKIMYLKAGEIRYFGSCDEFFSKKELEKHFSNSITKSENGILINYV